MAYSYQMISSVLYSVQYHRQHCTLHAFQQSGALHIHDLNGQTLPISWDVNPLPLSFEPHRDRMIRRGRPGTV